MEADKPYDAYDAVALEVRPLERRVKAIEKVINDMALAILPSNYKEDKKATIVIQENSRSKTRKMMYACSSCKTKIEQTDMFCRKCGARFTGITIGAIDDAEN